MLEAAEDLGVLATTREVVDRARLVQISQAAVERVADGLRGRPVPVPAWDSRRHFADGTPRTAQYVLLLDALNFCFWGEPRWQVPADPADAAGGADAGGRWLNGYWALAVALRRAVERGVPILDARYLAELDLPALAAVLDGRGPVPLLAERLANAREAGRVLLDRYGGQFANAIAAASGSALALVRLLVRDFPSFVDVASYEGREVRFDKRAQICAADLAGAFGGKGLGRFHDLARLTAFADYKVPQVLRRLGILVYAPELAATVDSRTLIPAGSPPEVEIRAATVWGVEALRRALAARGSELTATEVDWFLWELGQQPSPDDRPYHLTRTIYY